MTANAFDTLKAAKALKDAGFDEAQAEAVVATVGDAVGDNVATMIDNMATKEQLASAAADLSDRMATKEQLASAVADLSDRMATKEQLASAVADLSDRMATKEQLASAVTDLSVKMATKEYVAASIAELRAEIAVEFKWLYRHLWLMAASIVGVTVALGKLIP